jgi:HEPN domain-containing protein
MKRATAEWADKAEGDWQVAQRESMASSPVWDAVCFHAQQCVEKYLKALLEEHGIAFAKTHDLVVLLRLTEHHGGNLESLETDLAFLSPLGVAIRYPGSSADAGLAASALDIAGRVRSLIRPALNLPL